MCSTLGSVDRNSGQRKLIGFISDEVDASTRYNVHVVGEPTQDVQLQSLEEILAASSASGATMAGLELSRRDHLYLAAVLACSVLQLHDSWLRPQWGSQDILFARSQEGAGVSLDRPYLSWHVSTPLGQAKSPSNDTLLPLGLAFVELSLGTTISALDQDLVGKAVKFKIADPVLQ